MADKKVECGPPRLLTMALWRPKPKMPRKNRWFVTAATIADSKIDPLGEVSYPRATVSSPNGALSSYPRLSPIPNVDSPSECQELECATSNKPPRASLHGRASVQVPLSNGDGHPWGLTTHICAAAVDGRTRSICAGLPIRKGNDDQYPSTPSLLSGQVFVSTRKR